MTTKTQHEPPWEFLLAASRNTLQSYELSRLAHAANLGKEIKQLLDAYVEENSAAMLARLLMEQREQPPQDSAIVLASEPPKGGPSAASDNFLSDRQPPLQRIRGGS